MEKTRIAAPVDGIFAVAMALLDLKLPEGVKINGDPESWRRLLELTGRILTYALSFIVLGTFWIGHHSLFHFVRKINLHVRPHRRRGEPEGRRLLSFRKTVFTQV
jgi:uncharacterized membrane protein